METVNNVVNAASKVIWGEQNTAEERTTHNETHGEEPVSGVKGAGNAEEPFDKGNVEPTTTTSSSGESEPNQSLKATDSTTEPSTTTEPKAPESKASESNATGTEATEPVNAEPEIPQPKATKSEASHETKHVPHDGQKLVERGELPHGTSKNPEQPMKLEDGSGQSVSMETPVASEKSVENTGMSSDSGDFNNTTAGTGKEVNPILEQEKVRDDSDTLSPEEDTASGTSDKDPKKVSKMAKLKDKLHIGSGKHT